MRSTYLIFVVLMSSLACGLIAAEPEQLRVYGIISPPTGEVSPERYSGSYRYIDAAGLSRQDLSLAEIIAQEPGVAFRQSGGLGSYTNISVRAATAAQTGVYLDGVKLNDAGAGSVNLAEFELLNVGAVEVFRGSTPLLLGGNPLGGAVNLRSPEIEGHSIKGLVGVGNWNTRRYQLLGQSSKDEQDFLFTLAHQGSENNFDYLNDNSTPFYSGDDQNQQRHNSDFSRDSLLAKYAVYPQEHLSYHALLQWSQRQQGVPELRNRLDNLASWDSDGGQLQIQRQIYADEPDDWASVFSVFLNTRKEDYNDHLGQIGLQRQHLLSDTRVGGLKTNWQNNNSSRTLAISGEVRQESLNANNLLENSRYRAERQQLQLATEYSKSFSAEQGVWSNTLSFESIRDQYRGIVNSEENSRGEQQLSFQTGLRYQFNPQWRVQANLGNYHRQPTFFEMFGNRGLFVGNEALRAEGGINTDAGVYWQQSQAAKKSASLVFFSSLRDELITAVYNAQGVGQSQNTGKNRVFGLELESNWEFTSRWQFRFNLTWQDSENRSSIRAFQGKQLPGIADLSTYSRLQYQRNHWRAWYELDTQSERYFDSANLLSAARQTLHNAGLRYQRDTVEISLAINNISDKNYQDFNGFPKPGRSVHLTVSYKLNSESTL